MVLLGVWAVVSVVVLVAVLVVGGGEGGGAELSGEWQVKILSGGFVMIGNGFILPLDLPPEMANAVTMVMIMVIMRVGVTMSVSMGVSVTMGRIVTLRLIMAMTMPV